MSAVGVLVGTVGQTRRTRAAAFREREIGAFPTFQGWLGEILSYGHGRRYARTSPSSPPDAPHDLAVQTTKTTAGPIVAKDVRKPELHHGRPVRGPSTLHDAALPPQRIPHVAPKGRSLRVEEP